MSYPGGKGGSGVAQTIINQQPPHEIYIEPFAGGATVLLTKRPASVNIALDRDREVVRQLRAMRIVGRAQVIWGDAIAYLERRRWTGRELVYCDPPYPFETRSDPQRRIYRCELSNADHIRLLNLLSSLPCMVQISSYWSELYANRLRDWRLIRLQAGTRGGPREECLWMNYPEPTALHDYRFLGGDYRERERIRKKVTRWQNKLASLSVTERRAILSALGN